MSPEHPESIRDESGVALIAALLAVVVLVGLAIVFVAMAISTSRATQVSRDAEIAIHVAEAGADEIVSRVNWNKDYTTSDSDGEPHELPAGLDESEQREWAVEQVLGDVALESLTTGVSGDGFGIRPQDPDSETDEAHDIIFGVSFVPSRERPERIRVVRLLFQREFFQPQHGIHGCGDVNISGSAQITGDLGSVHSNGTVHVSGNGHFIEQGITASGSVTGNNANAGSVTTGVEPEDCPEVFAEDVYPRAGPPFTCYTEEDCPPEDGPYEGADGNTVLWWDLCPDGTARKIGSAPCEGEIVYIEPAQGGQANNHKGWRYQEAQGQAPPRWETTSVHSGVFYIHETNARVAGSGDATATILVAMDEGDDGKSGNLRFRGSGQIIPALEGIVLVTDRDLEMPGSPGGGTFTSEGMIAVGEQADLAGTATFNGPVYIRDDPHTTHSPVGETEVRGNFSVNYNNQVDITLLGSIRITAWNELR